MQKNDLLQNGDKIVRVLALKEDAALIVDCSHQSMPRWVSVDFLADYKPCTDVCLPTTTSLLTDDSNATAHKRFAMISAILPFVGDKEKRCMAIAYISQENNISKQTMRHYLWLYLVYQDVSALATMEKPTEKELSTDEKNMRWGLNKFFYTKHQNSLKTAYTMLLKARYCDSSGVLTDTYPTFNQFRYFYRKTRTEQKFIIARKGLKEYQKNYRPLLGDGVQEYAPHIGIGMLDATVCDIYLVNEEGRLVGRPILTACVDAYSSLCCGYSLSWEGGVYSLRNLMANIMTDKVELCKSHGIEIQASDWDCHALPSTFVTDMGKEYTSNTFEQIAELGVKVVNLPPYRPELKGVVEKFFDLIQSLYKPSLKGKGVIEADFQQRGAHDYRKDACLTMKTFETIILRCVVYYNCKRLMENYPYTENMVRDGMKPYANAVWNYGKQQVDGTLLSISAEQLFMTLLPRTRGKFTRYGLKVNGLRYNNENYTERYLVGGDVTVAYDHEDTSCVWLIEKGSFVPFQIIESRYKGKTLSDVDFLKQQQKSIVEDSKADSLQGKIDLLNHIEALAEVGGMKTEANIKTIRKNRQKEQQRTHKNYTKGI